MAIASSTPPAPLTNTTALVADYREFLDIGRTPAHVVAHTLKRGGWTIIDVSKPPPSPSEVQTAAGQRIAFINRHRSILFVIVGKRPLAENGFRLVGAHIDTPSPRLITTGITRANQSEIATRRYGGTKPFHWEHRPLAIVGSIATADGNEQLIDIGLHDNFSFWAHLDSKGVVVVTTGSTPTAAKRGFPSLVDELGRRYHITAADLETAELYVVPREPARLVGLDGQLIGAHGHDDRANSYVAWRAITDLKDPPAITAMTWLLDREEIGSTGTTGAQSRFLEGVATWLLRAQGNRATEAVVHRMMARSEIISSDTPACMNPNWPEAHEALNVPRAGSGPAVFPYTGRAGKQGGSSASGSFIAKLRGTFDRAGVSLQFGLLGHVDRGGGGTIAKFLAHRGANVLDIGVCVISMHSPLELVATRDLWSLYIGLKSWFGEVPRPSPQKR